MASENKVDPKGHQYACDENQLSKKRYDPTRKNFLKPISNIQNIFSNNCFINSVIQLFKNTDIQKNCLLRKETTFVKLMELLNQGIDLSEMDIRNARKEWSPQFNLCTEEDPVEFCQFMLEKISSIQTDDISVANAFKSAYHQTYKKSFECVECSHKFDMTECNFILTVPSINYSLKKNIESIMEGNVQRICEKCNCLQTFHYNKILIKAPEYLFIQILRFHFKQETQEIEKNFTRIDIPEKLSSIHFNSVYNLFGIVYHVGDSCEHGHCFSKCLSKDGVETYDDSRCHLNHAEKHLMSENAYLIVYKKDPNHMAKDMPLSFSDKVRELFIQFSDLLSLHIFDLLQSINDNNSFVIVFDQFCKDLIEFQMLWFNRLYEFTVMFSQSRIAEKPVTLLVRSILSAGYKAKFNTLTTNKNIVIYLGTCIDNDIASLDTINTINNKVKKHSRNKEFIDLINNLEKTIFLSFWMKMLIMIILILIIMIPIIVTLIMIIPIIVMVFETISAFNYGIDHQYTCSYRHEFV